MDLITAYLLVINIIAFAAYGADKYKAKRGRWRIPESTLLMLAVVGGAFGAWLGMRIFRHKTRHWSFRLLIPLLILLWSTALIYFTKHF